MANRFERWLEVSGDSVLMATAIFVVGLLLGAFLQQQGSDLPLYEARITALEGERDTARTEVKSLYASYTQIRELWQGCFADRLAEQRKVAEALVGVLDAIERRP